MKKMMLFTLLALAIPFAVQAQDLGGWDIQADVDGDGVVGPTDIQHVINDALGLNAEGPDVINVPRRQYVVASPRAALVPFPRRDNTSAVGNTVGAVDNFPRPHGRLLVKEGTVVTLRYDRNVEGVWYTGACGLLRSVLRVEMRRLPIAEDTAEREEPANARPGQKAAEDDPVLDRGDDPVIDGEDPDSIIWTPIGRDGAEAKGCGPAIGTATIAVRTKFDAPGDYLLRAHIDTVAVPQSELTNAGGYAGAVRKHDAVLVHVRVLAQNAEPTDARWRWQETRNAESIPDQFGEVLDHELDEEIELPNAETR